MIRPVVLPVLLALLATGCDGEATDAPIVDNEAFAAGNTAAPPEPPPPPPFVEATGIVPIKIETAEGTMTIELDAARAPVTANNFLRYVDAGSFDDIVFYRAAPTPGTTGSGFIQGGIRTARRRMFAPIPHEPTSETGITHQEGTISMARPASGAAMAEFFITASALPQMDAANGEPGYAAFGRVTDGMDVVRRILAAPTTPDAGRGAMRGQMIAEPVPIVEMRRAE